MFHFLVKEGFRLQSGRTTVAVASSAVFSRNGFSTSVSDEKVEPFTVSYLRNTCGLSKEVAIKTSKQIQLKNTEKPDLAIRTLKDYGLSDSQIGRVVVRLPRILSCNIEKTMKPKFDYLESIGITGSSLGSLLIANPTILKRGLEGRIIPCVDCLKSIVPSPEYVLNTLKLTNLFKPKHASNAQILKKYGLADDVILKFFTVYPRSLMRTPERFEQTIKKVKDMGFSPQSMLFAHAAGTMSSMSDSTWERKVAFYKSLGWSENDFVLAYRKQPFFMGCSVEDIQRKMEFYEKTAGYDPKFFVQRPRYLMSSLEGNLVPRWSVLKILLSKCLIKSIKGTTMFLTSDKIFFDIFVDKYKNEVPQVLEAYKGKLQRKKTRQQALNAQAL